MSKAGLTKRWYCSRTPVTSRPLSWTSRWIRRASRTSSSVKPDKHHRLSQPSHLTSPNHPQQHRHSTMMSQNFIPWLKQTTACAASTQWPCVVHPAKYKPAWWSDACLLHASLCNTAHAQSWIYYCTIYTLHLYVTVSIYCTFYID